MVHRKGSRFGISTNHKVRRLPFPYKQAHAQECVVVETKVDARGQKSKKQAQMNLKSQLQKDSFNIVHDETIDETSDSLRFSLNKARRWEVIKEIKENVNHHSNRYVIREHHMLHGSSFSALPCIEVFDSAKQGVPTPRKKYAHPSNPSMASQSEMVKDESDFGKKNRKRSRKRQARREEEVAESVIQYDVSRAMPRETYQTYTKPSVTSGHKHRNSRNRSKKFQQCTSEDVFCDEFWPLPEEEEENEEEEYTPFQDSIGPSEIVSYHVDLETLVGASMNSSAVRQLDQWRDSGFKPFKSTKDRVFLISEEEETAAGELLALQAEEEYNQWQARNGGRKGMKHGKAVPLKVAVEDYSSLVQPKPSYVTSVLSDDITEEILLGRFGDSFFKGQSMPRRFAINVSDRVIHHLTSDPRNAELSAALRQTGHHIFAIFESSLDPWVEIREDGERMERVRVKVCGVEEGQETLQSALTTQENNSISDVIDAVSQSVACLPVDRFLMDEVPLQAVKPSYFVETVQTTLGWNYHTTNPNKAVQTAVNTMNTDSEHHMVSQEASNACESCGICYTEFDEDNQGTALAACGHWFCDECWGNHLATQIKQGTVNITCPEYKCTTAVDRVTVMSLVPSKLFSRHHANQTNSVLMQQSDLQWCPSPRCGRLLNLSNPNTSVAISCECGAFWCSGCKEEAHWPATCQQAKVYREKARKLKSAEKNEVLVRSVQTKPCPGCFYPIEKYYGCNNMICKCGYYFCWACGAGGRSYVYHDCKLRGTWDYKVYHIQPLDIIEKTAVERARDHHRETTSFAYHRRIRKIRRLATQMLINERGYLKESLESASSLAIVTNEPHRYRTVRKLLAEVASFLSEAEFVLEYLEILLSSLSNDGHKRALFQHKMRLVFITRKLHKLFKEEAVLTVADAEHLLKCGKDCLRWIAMSKSDISACTQSNEE